MDIFTSFYKAWFGGVEHRVIVIGSNKKAIKTFLRDVVHSDTPVDFQKSNIIKFQKDTVMLICACFPDYVTQEMVNKLRNIMLEATVGCDDVSLDVYILQTRDNYFSRRSLLEIPKLRIVNMKEDFADPKPSK
jgi:hypothetical protein